MKTLPVKSGQKFLAFNPTKLATHVNQLGQKVNFYEHPIYGEDSPVFAEINGRVTNTEFYDLEDFTYNNESTEYMPVLKDGAIKCAFEFGID